jgi:cell division septation protein DedD
MQEMDWVREKTRLQLNQIDSKGDVTAQVNVTHRHSKFFTLIHKFSWLAGVIAFLSLIIFIVWKFELVDASKLHRSLVELSSQFSTTDTEGLREDIDLLTEQVQMLTTSVSDLKIKLLRINAATNSGTTLGNVLASDVSLKQGAVSGIATQIETLPAPAAGMPSGSDTGGKDTDKSGDAINRSLVAKNKITPTAPGIQAQETITNNGPWVINLASFLNKADAENFIENAESRGVTAGLYQVTVNGKIYWRVRVSGFATAAEAKTKTSLIKEKLGLKDVWVTLQKPS